MLETAIDRGAGEKGWPASWLLPRREAGRSCPRCSGTIERLTLAGRGSYYCPGHQA
ncbi:MAG: zinc finger domain-containing protein [Desulfurivibrionaceae bacterium]